MGWCIYLLLATNRKLLHVMHALRVFVCYWLTASINILRQASHSQTCEGNSKLFIVLPLSDLGQPWTAINLHINWYFIAVGNSLSQFTYHTIHNIWGKYITSNWPHSYYCLLWQIFITFIFDDFLQHQHSRLINVIFLMVLLFPFDNLTPSACTPPPTPTPPPNCQFGQVTPPPPSTNRGLQKTVLGGLTNPIDCPVGVPSLFGQLRMFPYIFM